MAQRVNAIEGEVECQYQGQTYRLRFDFNTMVDFERETGGRSLMAALSPDDGTAPSSSDLLTIFWLCFAEHHPEVDLRKAGRIYSADMEVLNRLMAVALPSSQTAEVGGLGNGRAA